MRLFRVCFPPVIPYFFLLRFRTLLRGWEITNRLYANVNISPRIFALFMLINRFSGKIINTGISCAVRKFLTTKMEFYHVLLSLLIIFFFANEHCYNVVCCNNKIFNILLAQRTNATVSVIWKYCGASACI